MRYCKLVFLISATLTTLLSAQTSPLQRAFDAHKGEFDYLLGDWEFSVTNPQYGTNRGYWSAVRLADGQILDEHPVLGGHRQTYYVTTPLRNHNRAAHR